MGIGVNEKMTMTLGELATATGVPERTIRYYIARGLLQGPKQRGRHAHYTHQHLECLQEIAHLKHDGQSLATIAEEIRGDGSPAIPSRSMRQIALAEDVLLYVADDASPWRKKLILDTAAHLSAALKRQSQPFPDQGDQP